MCGFEGVRVRDRGMRKSGDLAHAEAQVYAYATWAGYAWIRCCAGRVREVGCAGESPDCGEENPYACGNKFKWNLDIDQREGVGGYEGGGFCAKAGGTEAYFLKVVG